MGTAKWFCQPFISKKQKKDQRWLLRSDMDKPNRKVGS